MQAIATEHKRVDIRRNDTVKVLSGRDKGKQGRVLRVMPDIEADEPELLRSAFIHGVKRMDCTFQPRA